LVLLLERMQDSKSFDYAVETPELGARTSYEITDDKADKR